MRRDGQTASTLRESAGKDCSPPPHCLSGRGPRTEVGKSGRSQWGTAAGSEPARGAPRWTPAAQAQRSAAPELLALVRPSPAPAPRSGSRPSTFAPPPRPGAPARGCDVRIPSPAGDEPSTETAAGIRNSAAAGTARSSSGRRQALGAGGNPQGPADPRILAPASPPGH